MSGVMHEPRTAVMILVEASWKDGSGALQAVPARMENKSAGGACIRIKTPIGVGSTLRIKGYREQFSGIAKYCRGEGKEYLVGIQKNTSKNPALDQPVPAHVPLPECVTSSNPPVSTAKIQSPPKQPENKPNEIPAAERKVDNSPIVALGSGAAAMPPHGADHEIDSGRPRISQPQDLDALRGTKLQTNQPPKGKEAGKERRHMRHKWLELAHWHHKPDDLGGSGNGNSVGKDEKGRPTPQVAPPTERTPAAPAEQSGASFQVELLPVEDIYRAAGIVVPRRGYSINKVVEMLHSEHIRGLSKEMRRAAVLMALDAAGTPIDEVLQGAKARQDALHSYEAEQRKQVEAEWARKAEENVQIEAELERVKAHCMARISRNLDAVAREKATFSSWLTTKQQESQRMSEAADLFLKSTVSEKASASLSEAGRVEASAKPV
jgi:hypothetical protein